MRLSSRLCLARHHGQMVGISSGFHDFDVTRCAMLSDEEIEELTHNTDIVRHGTKIASVRANALYILDIRAEHGSFGAFMAGWPDSTSLAYGYT